MTVTAGALTYDIAVDLAIRQVALAILRIVDEDLTPVTPTATPASSDPRIAALAKRDGFVVLSGDPAVALPDPATPPAFAVTLAEPGFRPATVPIVLPPNPVLPVMQTDLVLRRLPRTLEGRVVAAATGAPLSNASIALVPSPAIPGQSLLVLATPLAADVPAATPVQGFPLTAVGGAQPVKRVLATVPAGSTHLELDDRQDLAAGQVLRLGPAERSSLARIGFVAPVPADLTKPGLVLLATPLTATARADDAAEAFTLGAPAGPAVATTGMALAGEALLLVDALPAGEALIIGPPASGTPYLRPPVTGADGNYRFSGIARIPRFDVTAARPGFTPQTRAWIPAAGTGRIDWRLKP